MMRPGETWRVSWKCPRPECEQLHRVIGTHEEVFQVAWGMTCEGVSSVLVQENTIATMNDLDMAEEGDTTPQTVIDLTQVFKEHKAAWK